MSAPTDTAMLNWLEKHPECEVSCPCDEEGAVWMVHQVTGGRNDREWWGIGKGKTVREAIRAAMEKRP